MDKGWKRGISQELREKVSIAGRLEHLKEAMTMQRRMQTAIDRMRAGRMDDLSLIVPLYEEYRRISAENGFGSDARNDNNKQFLFVILLLYCPECIFGGEVHRGLRCAIASVLNLKSGHIVYSMRDKAAVWYRTYPAFREEVDTAYRSLMECLQESMNDNIG